MSLICQDIFKYIEFFLNLFIRGGQWDTAALLHFEPVVWYLLN